MKKYNGGVCQSIAQSVVAFGTEQYGLECCQIFVVTREGV